MMTSTAMQLKGRAQSQVKEMIRQWVSSNSYSLKNKQVWKVGICTGDQLLKVQGQILADMECIHWKYWKCDSFQEAFFIMKDLNKNAFIMKSELSDYLNHGTYLFIYKTQIAKSEFLGHLINFPAQLSISR